MEDPVALRNGNTLRPRPVPAPQGELINALAGSADSPGEMPDVDPRLTEPNPTRPPDGSRPEISTGELDEAGTVRLARACRDHGVTVHAALCAAATRSLNPAGRDFIRIVTPKDPRRNVGLSDDVALRLMPSRTGFARENSEDFWQLTRDRAGVAEVVTVNIVPVAVT